MRFRRTDAVLALALLSSSFLGVLVACGGDDNNNNATGDGGYDAHGDGPAVDVVQDVVQDGSAETGGDSGGDAGTLNVVGVNALVTVDSAIRMCLAASPSGTPGLANPVAMNPEPADPAGIGAGLLATLNIPASVVGQNVAVFAYYVSSLNAFNLASSSCEQLFNLSILNAADGGTGGVDAAGAELIQGVDFDVSDVISASALNATSKFVMVATGCPRSSDTAIVSDGYCGQPNDAGVLPFLGTFHVWAYQLDPTKGAGGNARVQGLHANELAEFLGGFPPWNFGVDYADAGPDSGPTYLSSPDGGGFQYQGASGPVPPGTDVPPLTSATALVFANPTIQILSTSSISVVQQLSNLSASDLAGQSFTVVFIGDPFNGTGPRLADGGPNPRYTWGLLVRNDTP